MVRVLMLGWEFPPYFVGGVGTVCYELTRGLARKGVEVTYVMPHGPEQAQGDHVRLLVADREMSRLGVKSKRIKSTLLAYESQEEYLWRFNRLFGNTLMSKSSKKLYGDDLLQEVYRFADAVVALVSEEEFDVIHAHDWTTIPAALALGKVTGKPVVLHVHITEFDKSGGEHADPEVYKIEYEGFHAADIVIPVSNFVKRRLMNQYYVPENKIRVVHNSVEFDHKQLEMTRERLGDNDKLVLFLGRITLQKGPDYFMEAARKVCLMMPNVKFIMAGTGDMLPRMVERAADLGLGHKFIFTGFVSRDEGDRLYRMADLFVMPSVSEPFGIVPLEAMRQGTPVIVSKQSGVSEVIKHALKVDFWDTDDTASKIVASLTYSELHGELKYQGTMEVQSFTWDTPAEHCIKIYEEAMRARAW
ncbi:glycosyltransferase family 4 protein [Candidatus Woesearchaeota archaeon]|nr:glycosyltransferase family 4 protein [Candidatus Woesearchaeota archaeon]